jgi:2-keto-4-pentenoate hydratase
MDIRVRPGQLSDEQIKRASDLLFQCWTEGHRVAALPESFRPATRAEGYAIQALLEQHSGKPLYGWKIAATSVAGQKHIGVDGPLAGRLLAERVCAMGAKIPMRANYMRVAEVEFAFRMARELAPRKSQYEMREVLGAVASLHPAIEIPDSRYDDFAAVGAPQLIADNACAHYFVLGPATPLDWRTRDLAEHRVTARLTGKPPVEGKGANVLGDPRLGLTWLANELSQLGIPLKAGQVITTGTCVTPMRIAPGDELSADFGVLGAVAASFSE